MQHFTFKEALPVWAAGREKEMNLELHFSCIIPDISAVVYIAASSCYRLFVNEEFVAAGPARTAHGFYCVDEISLTEKLRRDKNTVTIQVLGTNVNSYDLLDQPAFLTAEVCCGERVIAATGKDFRGVYPGERIQRIQRYSFQRTFLEAYRIGKEFEEDILLSVQEEKKYLRRPIPMPNFEPLDVQALVGTGITNFENRCENPVRDRAMLDIGPIFKGYSIDELEVPVSDIVQGFEYFADKNVQPDCFPLTLNNSYGIYQFPFNATGFYCVELTCETPCDLYCLFDEVLTNGDVDILRLVCYNCFVYYLQPGHHRIMTFAPYTMKYLKLVCHGSCVVENVSMIQFKHPEPQYRVRLPQDEVLQKIYAAAVETYQANAVDLLTDCPSRERACWLCDSFFTARVEQVLTGKNLHEQMFLENFLLPESFSHLPNGVLPMCYPADHPDGIFIPNWAMWYVLELEEALKRMGSFSLADKAKKRLYQMLEFFKQYENEDGLLENLPSWVFLEWSQANEFVQNVNYPSNMLYVKMLETMGEIYGDVELKHKADRLKQTIRKQAFDGMFFVDNALRIGEDLINTNNRTEVCQYYAFFTGVATKEQHAVLWNTLIDHFGPQRTKTGAFPEIWPANAFIGQYLRVELLYLDGDYDRVLGNIRDYFLMMAETTGTLWEHSDLHASGNHGFASHVIYWLAGIFGAETAY